MWPNRWGEKIGGSFQEFIGFCSDSVGFVSDSVGFFSDFVAFASDFGGFRPQAKATEGSPLKPQMNTDERR